MLKWLFKRIFPIFMILTLIGAAICPIIDSSPVVASQANWITGWSYRVQISITGGAATDNFYALTGPTLYYGSGTNSNSSIYLNSQSLSDFSDVRVTDVNGNIIPYVLSNVVNSSSASISFMPWSIPAAPASTILFIYYGNSSPPTVTIPPIAVWNTTSSAKIAVINERNPRGPYYDSGDTNLYYIDCGIGSGTDMYSASNPAGPYTLVGNLGFGDDVAFLDNRAVDGNWYAYSDGTGITVYQSKHLTYGWTLASGANNPIIPNGFASWGQWTFEPDIIRDPISGNYYIVFCGETSMNGTGIERCGEAVSSSPIGPFTLMDTSSPIINNQNWNSGGDDQSADPEIMYDSYDKIYILTVTGTNSGKVNWSEGIYIATNIAGPWIGWPGNAAFTPNSTMPQSPVNSGYSFNRGELVLLGTTYYKTANISNVGTWEYSMSAQGSATGYPSSLVHNYVLVSNPPVINSISSQQQFGYPSCLTIAATNIAASTATLNGIVTEDNGTSVQYKFEYGTSTTFNFSTTYSGSLSIGSTFTANITGLSSNTTYYFRADVENANSQISYGNVFTFHTSGGASVAVSFINSNNTAMEVGADCTAVQTFTLTNTYLVSQVQPDVYITGTPGTITAGLYATDANGKPTGGALVSNTFDSSTCTTSTSGAIAYINFTPTSFTPGVYALVLSGTGTTIQEQFYTAVTNTIVNNAGNGDGAAIICQTFKTNSSYTISSINIEGYLMCAETVGTVNVYLEPISGGVPSGSQLSHGTIAESSITTSTSGAWYNCPMTSYTLSANTEYAIVLNEYWHGPLGCFDWMADSISHQYTDGSYGIKLEGSTAWSMNTNYVCDFSIISTNSDNGLYWLCYNGSPSFTGGTSGFEISNTGYYMDSSLDFNFAVCGSETAWVDQNFFTGASGGKSVYGTIKDGQTFTPSATSSLQSITLNLYRGSNDPGIVTCEVYATSGGIPTGAVLSTGTVAGSTLTTSSSGASVSFTMSAYTVVKSTVYAIELSAPSATSSTSQISFGTGGNNWGSNSGGTNCYQAMDFTTTSSFALSAIAVYIQTTGNVGTITCALKATSSGTPTGSVLSSGTISGTSTLSAGWYTFNMSAYTLSATTQYSLYLYSSTANASNYLSYLSNNGGTYSGGGCLDSANSGSTWTTYTAYKGYFNIYSGSSSIVYWSNNSSGGYSLGNRVYSTDGSTWTADSSSDDLFKTYVGVVILAPTCTTNSATSISTTSAVINGTLTYDGGTTCSYEFYYGNTPENLQTIGTWAGSLSTNDTFTCTLTGLSIGTTYYYEAFAQNSTSPTNGNVLSFTTSSITITTLTTAASGITTANATLNGTLTNDGGESCSVEFEYGTSTAYGTESGWISGKGTGDNFSALLTGLAPNLYHFRSDAKWADGTEVYGNDLTFTILVVPPSAPGSLTITGYSSTGSAITIDWVNGLNAPNSLIVYRTDTYPTAINDGTQLYSGSDQTVTLQSPIAGATYYISAWGMNNGVYSTNYTTAVTSHPQSIGLDFMNRLFQGGNGSNLPFYDYFSTLNTGFSTNLIYSIIFIILAIVLGIMCSITFGGSVVMASFGGATGLFLGEIAGVLPLYIILVYLLITATIIVVQKQGA